MFSTGGADEVMDFWLHPGEAYNSVHGKLIAEAYRTSLGKQSFICCIAEW